MAPQTFTVGGSESISYKKSPDAPQQQFLFNSNSGSGFRSEPIRVSSRHRGSPNKQDLDDNHEEDIESENDAEHANLGLLDDNLEENSLDSSRDEAGEVSDRNFVRETRKPAKDSAEESDSEQSKALDRSNKARLLGEAPTGFPSLPISKSRTWFILDPISYQEQSIYQSIRLHSKRAEESKPVVRFNRASVGAGADRRTALRPPSSFNSRARNQEPVKP
jgi:hypothetical protein